jgi:hypothetical protein
LGLSKGESRAKNFIRKSPPKGISNFTTLSVENSSCVFCGYYGITSFQNLINSKLYFSHIVFASIVKDIDVLEVVIRHLVALEVAIGILGRITKNVICCVEIALLLLGQITVESKRL